MATTRLSEQDVTRFLGEQFDHIGDVVLLASGAWSSAFAFRSAGRELVAKFGRYPEDYAKDLEASAWARSNLPIPAVLAVGEAFDGACVLSERRFGDSLADVSPDRFRAVLEAHFDALVAMREIDVPGRGFGMWQAPGGGAPFASWAEYLNAAADRNEDRLPGWRRGLADHAGAREVFDRSIPVLERLTAGLPDRRQVIHADLLNNILVSRDNRLTAVFDWGNSLAGDPLYDVAWLAYCAPWYPGLDPNDVMRLARERFDEPGLEQRVACYELHISVDSMQYHAFTGRSDELEAAMRRTATLLDRLESPWRRKQIPWP